MKKFVMLLLCLECYLLTKPQPDISTTAFDKVIGSDFKSDESGGIALIMQKGKIVYKRASSEKLAAIALGRADTAEEIVLSDSLLQSYTGVYILDTVRGYITFSNHALYYHQGDSRIKLHMKPYAIDKFFFKNTSVLGEIQKDDANKITGLLTYDILHPFSPIVYKRTDLPLPVKE